MVFYRSEFTSVYRYISEFSRVRLDDPEQATNQRYKGLLRIEL
jgi:hypothetical protein